jgi:hypothetical protein
LKIWTDAAGHIAVVGRVFDLPHLGAEIGKLHRAVWPGAILLDCNDPEAGEDGLHGHFLTPSLRAQRSNLDPRKTRTHEIAASLRSSQ